MAVSGLGCVETRSRLEAYNDLAGALIATVPLPINRIAMKLTTAGFIPRLFTLD
jgi:hypothetical protein